MSINSVEFGYTDAACNTTIGQPGKFIVGIDTCKLESGSSYNLLMEHHLRIVQLMFYSI